MTFEATRRRMGPGRRIGRRRPLAAAAFLLVTLAACGAARLVPDAAIVPVAGGARGGVAGAAAGIDYDADVRPILASRCVACHACYDAPCQLKATAPEGLERGASKAAVYHSTRLTPADPTRLFVDAGTVPGWRAKGFFPVLGEVRDDAVEAGLLRRYLDLKERHPPPTSGTLSPAYTFAPARTDECPTLGEFDAYARRHPEAGMPYGLPALAEAERATLISWLDAGAPYRSSAFPERRFWGDIETWERFFNRSTNRGRLTARYLYEHLFQAQLFFPDVASDAFFRLVRSTSPPGEPVALVASRRPFDDPGVGTLYYRLVPERETPVLKTHNPYALDAARLARLEALFFDGRDEIESLPDYPPAGSANPFVAFEALPMEARYRFMLDEARFTIANYIRGSVCRGQIAVSVIRDRFWVVFLAPDSDLSRATEAYLPSVSHELDLANRQDSSNGLTPVLHWGRYEAKERRHHGARDAALARWFGDNDLSLDLIWDGEGVNANAALTVFRHRDNASVEPGLLGADPPDTAWVIDYPLLERIHYLLVADYDVFGTLGHQLTSRLHMDFLRMQGEKNLLGFVPPATREAVRERWYRDAPRRALDYMANPELDALPLRGIDYRTDDPLGELYGRLAERLAPVRPPGSSPDAELARLEDFAGSPTTLLAQFTLLRIEGDDGALRWASLFRNDAHRNLSSVFNEAKYLAPDENTVTVVPGVRAAYPNALVRLTEAELPAFVDAVLALGDEADYARLMDEHGIRRTDPDFWAYSDELHGALRERDPTAFGQLDYSRLENR